MNRKFGFGIGLAMLTGAAGLAVGLRNAPRVEDSSTHAKVAADANADSPALARDAAPEDSVAIARGLSKAFKDVARTVEPSVVHIVARQRRWERVGFFESRPTDQFVDAGVGSGVIVNENGTILTNNHVVAPAEKLVVRLRDGRTLPAKVIGTDPLTDLAVVKVDAQKLTPVRFADSDAIDVGEWVVAIGSPFGFANTVTAGIVSAKSRSQVPIRELSDEAYKDFIQTDAAINPGNSGGALLDLDGKLVGINSAIASRAGGSEGIGFAIPSNIASAVLDAILKNGRVVRGWLGASFQDVVASDTSAVPGVLVADVVAGSPAEGHLQAGDVVTRYQNRPMTALSTLRAAVALTAPGTSAEFDVIRRGEAVKVTIAIGDLEAVQSEAVGVEVRGLPESEARRMGYERGVKGVVVTAVRRGGVGAAQGIKVGDIIREVDETAVETPADFQAAIGRGNLLSGISLNVIRGDVQGQLRLTRRANRE